MNPPLLQNLPLAPLATELRSGRRDLVEYIGTSLERVAALDPRLNALLPEAGREARLQSEAVALLARYPRSAERPPLFGVLLGVKDIFHVDGLPTYAGSQVPPEHFAGAEAAVVSRLRAAGALVLGKTATTEFAYLDPTDTRNPWNLEYSPGGSSSGSAAAVAAGICPLALGTQTVGSVIRPAAFCGLVGFKPSLGRMPTLGVVPFSATCDTVGLFTQDPTGMALAAGLVCQHWRPEASGTAERPVLGVPDGPYLDQAGPEARAAFEDQVETLRAAGYEIRRLAALADIATLQREHRTLIAAELAAVHTEWFAEYGAAYGPHLAGLIRAGQVVAPAALAAARAAGPALRRRLLDEMTAAGIDAWLAPAATGPAPAGLASTGDAAMNGVWTFAGLPALTVPAGLTAGGLPLGLQVVAGWWADEALLAWGAGIAGVLGGGEGVWGTVRGDRSAFGGQGGGGDFGGRDCNTYPFVPDVDSAPAESQ